MKLLGSIMGRNFISLRRRHIRFTTGRSACRRRSALTAAGRGHPDPGSVQLGPSAAHPVAVGAGETQHGPLQT